MLLPLSPGTGLAARFLQSYTLRLDPLFGFGKFKYGNCTRIQGPAIVCGFDLQIRKIFKNRCLDLWCSLPKSLCTTLIKMIDLDELL